MTPGEFQEVDRIFQKLRRLPAGDRASALESEPNIEPSVRREVEALLSTYDDPESDAFLDTPALGSAFPVIPVGAEIPKQIGRYRIIEPLGEGGMARVFVAEQERPRRRVALKIMRTLLGPRAEKRFELEAMVLGRLRHPGIAQIYEAGIHQSGTDRLPYIAMELVEGERLTKLVAGRQLDRKTTLELFTRICDAVQHAHQQGVIHRDLKPSNILVEERDGVLLPRILDLGIARATDLDVQATTMGTTVGELVGTLQYMSPEQAAGDPSEIDTRTDVYSLGVILFELLTGKPPLELQGKPLHEALRIIREDDPQTMGSMQTTLRGDLELISRKAMEKDKHRRYQSARELVDDVRHFLRSEPITARQPSAAYQLRKFARRNRVLVAGAVCFCAAMAIGLVGMTWFAIGKSRALEAESQALAKSVSAQKEAETAQQHAERRFEEVRKLAGVFINDLDGQIRDLPGSTAARKFIVATGLEYLDSLEEEAGDDMTLRQQLGDAYFKLGNIQGYPDQPNLGDLKGAWASYQKGLSLLIEVQRAFPDDVGAKQNLSVAYSHCAIALESLGRDAEAKPYYDKSFELIKQVAAAQPDDPVTLNHVAYHENRIGDELRRSGKFDDAARHYQNAADLYAKVLRLDASNITGLRGQAATHDRFARLAAARGDLQDAIKHFQAYIESARAILDHGEKTRMVRTDLAVGYEKLGVSYRAVGQRDKAYEAFLKSLKIREAMVREDPNDMSAAASLRTSSCHVGEEELALGRRDAALRQFERYLQLSEQIATSEPNNAKARREQAVAYYKMAEWHLAAADDPQMSVADARSHREQALNWLTKCRDTFIAVKQDGLLWKSDAGVIDDLNSEIDTCQKTMVASGQSAGSNEH